MPYDGHQNYWDKSLNFRSVFGLISSFRSNGQLWVVLEEKSLQEYFSYYTLMTFLMILSVILLFMLMILLSTLKCDQASWQQLDLASDLESDLQDTVDWGKKWLVDFNAEKTC